MIKIEGLNKNYGDVHAVKNLCLKVENELFVFLGENGAGKSSTINMMTGLVPADSGHILLNGFDIKKTAVDAKRQFGLVPEKPFLYQKITPREFFQMVVKLYKTDPSKAQSRLDLLVDMFNLHEKLNTMTDQLSQGMKQKVAIIAALLHQPSILILDEPTIGLDPSSVKTFKDLLVELVKEGTTVFMSTHMLDMAENMCDRVGIIHKGELLATGSVKELKQQTEKPSLEEAFLSITKINTQNRAHQFAQNR